MFSGDREILSVSWKGTAKLSGTWGVIVGAFSLIMNAVPSLTIPLLAVLIPLSLAMPAVIAFFMTKSYAKRTRLETKMAAKHGAVTGVVYAVVMILIALFFIIINYSMAALVWGSLEVLGEGILVVVVTIIIGLPLLGVLSIISGAIGGVAVNKIN